MRMLNDLNDPLLSPLCSKRSIGFLSRTVHPLPIMSLTYDHIIVTVIVPALFDRTSP